MLKTTLPPFILPIFEHILVFLARWLMTINKLISLSLLLLLKSNMLYYTIMLVHFIKFGQFHTDKLKKIINNCSTCTPLHLWPIAQDINPWGLQPNNLWQMDVTHCPELSPSSFLHVSLDTNSSFIWATLLQGETTWHVTTHLLARFTVVRTPSSINWPCLYF